MKGAGKAPPNSRYLQVRIGPARAFRVDHDDYTDEDRARDSFYQEFLRPNGVFWHANIMLASGRDELPQPEARSAIVSASTL